MIIWPFLFIYLSFSKQTANNHMSTYITGMNIIHWNLSRLSTYIIVNHRLILNTPWLTINHVSCLTHNNLLSTPSDSLQLTVTKQVTRFQFMFSFNSLQTHVYSFSPHDYHSESFLFHIILFLTYSFFSQYASSLLQIVSNVTSTHFSLTSC